MDSSRRKNKRQCSFTMTDEFLEALSKYNDSLSRDNEVYYTLTCLRDVLDTLKGCFEHDLRAK